MASIKADEITKILKAQIANYEQAVAVEEVGTVISVGDGIARIYGLEKAMSGEMLAFPHDVFGIALNLEEDQVGAVLLGEYTLVQEGDTVKRTGTIMSAPVGEAMVGRVVSPLGLPLDGKGPSPPTSASRSSASLPALWTGNRCASRCRPESSPSIR